MKNDTQIYAFDWKQMTSQFGGKEWMLIEMDLMTLHHQQQQQHKQKKSLECEKILPSSVN